MDWRALTIVARCERDDALAERDRWRALLADVLADIGEVLTSEAIVDARESLADSRRNHSPEGTP